MSSIISGIRYIQHTIDYAAQTTCRMVFNAGFAAERAALYTVKAISLGMHDGYGMEGFEKVTKVAISSLKACAFFTGTRRFQACLNTLEAQKDVIYATLFTNSTKEFIGGDATAGYHLQIPKKGGAYDINAILMGIGNPLDTLAFIQKKGVYSFPLASQFSREVGGFRLAWGERSLAANEVPVLKTLFSRPKDFFVFFSSLYSISRSIQDNTWNLLDQEKWTVEQLVKLTGNIGKIVLISSGDYLSQYSPLALTLIDLVTQQSALVSYLMKCAKNRA